ncbi:MAG: AbrB/MazE/SpoVT family DNA-binding domain-containing protein [Phycisphaerales bacterium]|nr:AbrB/MazE/SpoVT family DNA-binding domain-containing protein [Phycisphaerales bacterium]
MPIQVKVRKWGNSLGLRLPRSFASQHAITDGTTVEIDDLKVASVRPRRSRYKLKDVLRNYVKPPKELDLPRVGKELL